MPDFVYLSKSTRADTPPAAKLGAIKGPQQAHIPVRRIWDIHIHVGENPAASWANSFCFFFGLRSSPRNVRRAETPTCLRLSSSLFLSPCQARQKAPPPPHQVKGGRGGGPLRVTSWFCNTNSSDEAAEQPRRLQTVVSPPGCPGVTRFLVFLTQQPRNVSFHKRSFVPPWTIRRDGGAGGDVGERDPATGGSRRRSFHRA